MAAKAEAETFRNEVAASRRGSRGQSAGRGDGVIDKKLDLLTCKSFAPPHSVVFHDPTTHRIRGYFCLEKRRPSRGCLLAHGQNVACRVVLTWLCQRYAKAFPGAPVRYSFPLPDDESAPVLAVSQTPSASAPSSSAASRKPVPRGGLPSSAIASSSSSSGSRVAAALAQPEGDTARVEGGEPDGKKSKRALKISRGKGDQDSAEKKSKR